MMLKVVGISLVMIHIHIRVGLLTASTGKTILFHSES